MDSNTFLRIRLGFWSIRFKLILLELMFWGWLRKKLRSLSMNERWRFRNCNELRCKLPKTFILLCNLQETQRCLITFLETLSWVKKDQILKLTSFHLRPILERRRKLSFGKCSSLNELSKILRRRKKSVILDSLT